MSNNNINNTINTNECTHNFTEWVTIKSATSETDGIKSRTCSICGLEQTAIINKKRLLEAPVSKIISFLYDKYKDEISEFIEKEDLNEIFPYNDQYDYYDHINDIDCHIIDIMTILLSTKYDIIGGYIVDDDNFHHYTLSEFIKYTIAEKANRKNNKILPKRAQTIKRSIRSFADTGVANSDATNREYEYFFNTIIEEYFERYTTWGEFLESPLNKEICHSNVADLFREVFEK